ncbi:hypothetical protein AZE42_12424, partial [Rhizopogon vesiculosus]
MIQFGGRQSAVSVKPVISQLYALLWWYMIGVSKAIRIINRIIDVPTILPALTFGQEVCWCY